MFADARDGIDGIVDSSILLFESLDMLTIGSCPLHSPKGSAEVRDGTSDSSLLLYSAADSDSTDEWRREVGSCLGEEGGKNGNEETEGQEKRRFISLTSGLMILSAPRKVGRGKVGTVGKGIRSRGLGTLVRTWAW